VSQYREIQYTDELLSDRSVHRRFADGREEWRRRAGDQYVQWQDNSGRSGIDEALGGRIIKRTYSTGQVLYGRDQGYGRTAWGDGTLTINRTSFGGRTGAILAAVGAGALLGAVVAPPLMMSPFEEDELRRQAQQQQSSSSGSGSDGGDGGDGGDSHSWHDDSDGDSGSDDDFG
jgi:hypothetical protein